MRKALLILLLLVMAGCAGGCKQPHYYQITVVYPDGDVLIPVGIAPKVKSLGESGALQVSWKQLHGGRTLTESLVLPPGSRVYIFSEPLSLDMHLYGREQKVNEDLTGLNFLYITPEAAMAQIQQAEVTLHAMKAAMQVWAEECDD